MHTVAMYVDGLLKALTAVGIHWLVSTPLLPLSSYDLFLFMCVSLSLIQIFVIELEVHTYN